MVGAETPGIGNWVEPACGPEKRSRSRDRVDSEAVQAVRGRPGWQTTAFRWAVRRRAQGYFMSIGLVHLSDIHFGQERGGQTRIHEDVRESLIEDVGLAFRDLEAGRAGARDLPGDIGGNGRFAAGEGRGRSFRQGARRRAGPAGRQGRRAVVEGFSRHGKTAGKEAGASQGARARKPLEQARIRTRGAVAELISCGLSETGLQ